MCKRRYYISGKTFQVLLKFLFLSLLERIMEASSLYDLMRGIYCILKSLRLLHCHVYEFLIQVNQARDHRIIPLTNNINVCSVGLSNHLNGPERTETG